MKSDQTGQYGKIGSQYRSWGEEQIARFLDRHGFNYHYEYPLALIDRGMVRLYYPDFQLPELGMIIEYFGVNGNPRYDEQVKHKMGIYRQVGIEGLFLNRDSLRGNWPNRILGQMEDILQNRLSKFDASVSSSDRIS